MVDPVWGSTGSRDFNEWALCGGHVAETCAACPMQHGSGWCNGDCTWDGSAGRCVRTSEWSGAVENSEKTSHVPCCGGPGHPAYMAVDQSETTFWLSPEEPTSSLVVEILDGASIVTEVELAWTQNYAVDYSIEFSQDGLHFVELAHVVDGDGGTDQVRLNEIQKGHSCPGPFTTIAVGSGVPCLSSHYTRDCSTSCTFLNDCNGHGRCDGQTASCLCEGGWTGDACEVKTESRWRFMQLRMRQLAFGSTRYGLKEIKVYGDSYMARCHEVAPVNVTAPGLITARTSLTPKIASVEPKRGTTAGGSDVTVTGSFFTSDASRLNVTIGDFPCVVKSVETLSGGGEVQIKCVSGASGLLDGGKKYVIVRVNGYGSSAPVDSAVFWYIDTWSARTTWGGKAPPTGCGSWVDDKDCTDTVIIPEGQVVLLDRSLPRFYLILIEGTLLFDRTDIELSASYILLRGGTLQIGTELEPFEQQVKITLFGHPKSIELPTFGSKVIACYKCTMDIHGSPQQSWTSLSATAHPGESQISVMDAVEWPVGAKIVIATTDFESPSSSHSEVATVASVSGDGRTIQLSDIRVCHTYSNNGLPLICKRSDALSYPHLGEAATFDGRELAFRAEVGLLTRNIVIEGDYDETLCPLAELADDGITRLSCNQFGAQMFFHSPGHESLVARIANFELRNGGQAFRLGRYAIHWCVHHACA